MGSRLKEDEKHERIIRGLLKQPENRRCINCNSLGPQYVCTSFWTFVCTTCSGIHREFTHRVKSVSMAKFTSQEVAALREGGNQRARDIYLKGWDSQRQTGPDASNVGRLRDFIKHVYVDRRYTDEKGSGKPPSGKIAEKEDSYDNRRSDSYQGGSRSPPYEDMYDRRYSEMSSPGARSDNSRNSYDEKRSPGYDQESRQNNDFRRSPARPDIVTDWRREDRFGNGWKGEDRRVSDGDPQLESRSPEHTKELSSPPVVRSVREILGDNVIPLRVIEPPKPNVPSVANGSSLPQRTTSSSSFSSSNEKPVEVKLDSMKSLIDFDADPEPPAVVNAPQLQQTMVPQSLAPPANTTNDNNWASFDFSPQVVVSQASSSANPLESVLSQLSVSSSSPSHMPTAQGGSVVSTTVPGFNAATLMSITDLFRAVPSTVPVSSFPTYQVGNISAVTPVQQLSVSVNGGQWTNVPQHQQPSLFPASSVQATSQQYKPAFNGASGNQNMVMRTPNMQASFGTPSSGASSVLPTPAAPGGLSQAGETNSIGRKELPADLFATTYSPYHAAMPGWQMGPPRVQGYGMQYPVASPLMPTYIQQAKSVNPFDAGDPTQTLGPTHTFPSMATLQGALPNIPPSSGLQPTASLGAPLPAWMQPQSSPYPSSLPSQPHSHVSAVPPRPQGVQQLPPANIAPAAHHQATAGSSFNGATFVTGHAYQQQPFPSLGGNPFG